MKNWRDYLPVRVVFCNKVGAEKLCVDVNICKQTTETRRRYCLPICVDAAGIFV